MENRISSTRWFSSRVWLSRPYPYIMRSRPSCCLSCALQGRGEHVLADCVDRVCVRPGLVGHDVGEVLVGASSHEHAVEGASPHTSRFGQRDALAGAFTI